MGRSRSRRRRRSRSRDKPDKAALLLPLLQNLMQPQPMQMMPMMQPAPPPPMPLPITLPPSADGTTPAFDMTAIQQQIQSNLESFYSNMQNQMGGGGGWGGGGGGFEPDDDKESGYVVNWHVEKGFGFIKPEKGSGDIFCHVSAIKDGDCLREGDKVRFNTKYDEKVSKNRAEDVTGAWWERDLEREKKRNRDRQSRSRGRRRR